MPSEQFSAISWREQITFWWDDDDACYTRPTRWAGNFNNASSLKQQSTGRHVAAFIHILIPETTVHR